MKRPLLWLALGCHLVLATAYLLRLPAFEVPDENDHCYYAAYLASSGQLPITLKSAATAGREPWEEASLGHHPPLYYAVLAGTMGLLGDVSPAWSNNPSWIGQHPEWQAEGPDWVDRHPGSVLHWQHGADELAPVSPEIRALQWLRAWSVVFGLLSVALTYRLGRILFPAAPGIAGWAALLVACTPQWSMMHGGLDNGNLATTLSHVALVILAAAVRDRRITAATGATLGLVVGLAMITKLTAIFLIPLVAAVLIAAFWRWPEQRRSIALAAAIAALLTAAVCGWFLVRNAQLYGDLLGMSAHRAAFASNAVPADQVWSYLFGDFPWRVFRSTVGELGWAVLPVPVALLIAVAALLVLSAVGWLITGRALIRASGAALWVPLLAFALAFASLVRFNTNFIQPQGRYLFPAFGAMLVLVVAGLHGAVGGRLARLLARSGRWRWVGVAAPPLVAAGVFGLCFAPRFDPAATPTAPWYASMVAGLRTPPPAARATLQIREPADGARLAAAPTFRWTARDHAPGKHRYSLHFYAASGRVVQTTYEWNGLEITGLEWSFPAAVWPAIPAGEPLYCKVRRLPDRSAGETVADVPESPPIKIFRVE